MHHITLNAVREPGSGSDWQFNTDVHVDGLDYAEIADALGSMVAMLNVIGQIIAE